MNMQTLLLAITKFLKDCVAANVTIACYESCTGGALANLITNIAGASNYFKGGAIVYSSHAKITIAKLTSQFLNKNTTVAMATSHALASQCCCQLQATINIGITGYLEPQTAIRQSVVYVCFKLPTTCVHRVYYPQNRRRPAQKQFVLTAIINDLNSDLIKSKIKNFL